MKIYSCWFECRPVRSITCRSFCCPSLLRPLIPPRERFAVFRDSKPREFFFFINFFPPPLFFSQVQIVDSVGSSVCRRVFSWQIFGISRGIRAWKLQRISSRVYFWRCLLFGDRNYLVSKLSAESDFLGVINQNQTLWILPHNLT